MFDRTLSDCLDHALMRLARLGPEAPASAGALLQWSAGLSPTRRPRDYFEGGRAVMLLLPWWLEKRIRPAPDAQFQQLLVESTISAYYFVRLVDNVMDDHAREDRGVLPLLGIFQAKFFRAYARLFPPDALFWEHFDRHWIGTAEAALRETQLRDLSEADFIEVAARKTAGVKIPLAAVCCRYDRLDLLEPWCEFYDSFARWQQMLDDTFDWAHDLRLGRPTFFLSEGHRQKRDAESVSGWVVRRGFAWANARLASAMQDLRIQAQRLDSPELVRFLEYREAEVRECARELTDNLSEIATLVDVFEPVRRSTSRSDDL